MFSRRTNWNLQPNRLSEALERRRASGRDLLDLTASNPTQCGFDYDGDAILAAVRDRAIFTYDPEPKGLPAARRSVADYYAARGDAVSPDDVILTTSTSEAYSFIVRALCDPDDELLVPAPSYPLFDFLADIQDVKLARYPLLYDHGWQIDFHGLERAVTPRTRGIVVVHPNNPTGHFCKTQEAVRLNEICAARGMALIADEVFWDFSRPGDPQSGQQGSKPYSFSSESAALTFAMSGLSKISGLPQMKVAWLAAGGPQALKREALARLEMIADAYLSMNAIVQRALPAFLGQRHGFQRQIATRVSANLAELDRQLAAQRLCVRLAIEGGWYAVLRVPVTRTDEDLAIELLESAGVYVHPGHFYDFESPGFLIVSLITGEETFRKAVARVLAALQPAKTGAGG